MGMWTPRILIGHAQKFRTQWRQWSRYCSTTSTSASTASQKERLAAEEKKINAIWTSACVAGNPNTTAVDFPPDYSRFVIPPVAYQQTPWLERPTTGFNPIFPWIDANIPQDSKEETGEDPVEDDVTANRGSENVMDCTTKRTYQPNVRKRKTTHGFLVRNRTRSGRRILRRRMRKHRHRLSV